MKLSTKEKVFNLFLFVEDDIIIGLGGRCHQAEGSDQEKLAFLQRQVNHDLRGAERFPMPMRYHLVFPDGRTGTGIQYQINRDITAGAAWEFMDAGPAPHSARRGPLAGTLQGHFSTDYLNFLGLNVIWKF